MRLKKIGENALQWLFVNYLRWIERTVMIRWDEENRYGDSQIYGFWHEDSFFMNLVLEKLADKTRKYGEKVRRERAARAGRFQSFCST